MLNPIAAGIVTDNQLLLGLAVVGLAALLYARTRLRRRSLDGDPRQYRREIDSATVQSEAVKKDLEQLLAELEKLSRKIDGQVEGQMAELRSCLADGDKRISALRILIAEADRRAADAVPPTAQRPSPEADQERPSLQPPMPQPAAPTEPDERHRRIYALADQGLTAVQIATELQEPPGEVELILNLRTAGAGMEKDGT